MNIFFELHQDLPREAPGDDASTRKALSLLTDLPSQPWVLDVGCGPGMHTLVLAKETGGRIVAVDTHRPFLDTLRRSAGAAAIHDRIAIVNTSMYALPFSDHSLDAVWSEGAIYIIGFERGLREWQRLLKPRGYVVVSELSWLRPQPPDEIAEFWKAGYPAMRGVQESVELGRAAGYRPVAHFTLPESSWWDNYYRPLEQRIASLRARYSENAEICRLLENESVEIALFRKYPDWYGYVFFVMQLV